MAIQIKKYMQQYSRYGCEMKEDKNGGYIMVSDIVFCKDCKYFMPITSKDYGYCENDDLSREPDWFCASGEREDKR